MSCTKLASLQIMMRGFSSHCANLLHLQYMYVIEFHLLAYTFSTWKAAHFILFVPYDSLWAEPDLALPAIGLLSLSSDYFFLATAMIPLPRIPPSVLKTGYS